ncbi:MAG TPA: hypothetical protein VFT72_13200 [Opitutaceae bacterium]|nr:hypothetical protein [Opitutaceae bacterium]
MARLTWRQHTVCVCLGLTLLLPPWLNHEQFAKAFWFGDEFYLLAQIHEQGFGTWVMEMFSETFMPVFKAIWGALVFVSGSYAFILGAVWLLHALNGYLLARAMRRLGYGWIAAAACVLLFGLHGMTIETLTWSVQSCVMLCATTFLCALDAHLRRREETRSDGSGISAAEEVGWSAVACWIFTRGLLEGPVLAAVTLLDFDDRRALAKRIRDSITLLVVPLATGIYVYWALPREMHALGQLRFIQPLSFAWWGFGGNPLVTFFEITPTWKTVSVGAAVKIILFAALLWRERGGRRAWLLGLALFDVGNCLLLGVGRYNPDLGLSTSSRYQYIGLFTTMPFLAILLENVAVRSLLRVVRIAMAAAIVGWMSWIGLRSWRQQLPSWMESRGVAGRKLLLSGKEVPKGADVPGFPGFDNRRAATLVRIYDLR